MYTDSDTAQRSESQTPQAAISYLDPALWQAFQRADSLQGFAHAWLALQCGMINGVGRGLVIAKHQDTFSPQAVWPKELTDTADLIAVAETVLREKKGVVTQRGTQGQDNQNRHQIAFPITFQGEHLGVVAVEMFKQSESHLRSVMRQLQWGVSWFEVYFFRAQPEQLKDINQRLVLVLDMVTHCLEQRNFDAALTSVATELSSFLNCERVSIGFLSGKHMRVKALSHTASFDKRTNLARHMSEAMDEAYDQNGSLLYPSDTDKTPYVLTAHQTLAKEGRTESICTVPLVSGEKIIGAITLEHLQPHYFNGQNKQMCEQLALILGPLFDVKQQEARALPYKIKDSAAIQLRKIVGPKHFTFKLCSALVATLILCLVLIQTTYRVSGDAVIEGYLQRHIASPIDGYIAESTARAGDVVKQGQELFRLEIEDLELERTKWENQLSQLNRKYRDALLQSERTQIGVLLAQIDQAEAQLKLIKSQLNRAVAKAPFDGVIVSGDLRQRLGSPVTMGETLLKIAPLDAYRVILKVDERDITELRVGDQGQLSLSSMPERKFEFKVDKITPVSIAEEGNNVFAVEAELVSPSELLRPGMQGTGKVEVGERRLIWIFTHRFAEWLKLWWWRTLP